MFEHYILVIIKYVLYIFVYVSMYPDYNTKMYMVLNTLHIINQ